MGAPEELADAYERVVNERDEESQHTAAREALADDFTFVGPTVGEVAGRDAMVRTMRALRERAPAEDVEIRRSTPVDEHNGWLRFGWEFVDGDGQVVATGLDVGRLDGDGRLATLVAFFDEQPPQAG